MRYVHAFNAFHMQLSWFSNFQVFQFPFIKFDDRLVSFMNLRVSMGLTVRRKTAKNLAVRRKNERILAVSRKKN